MKNSTEESLESVGTQAGYPTHVPYPSPKLLEWAPLASRIWLVNQRTVTGSSFSHFWASAQQMSQHWGEM